jgi:glycerol-3-phosphate dehydrogenase
MRCIGPEAECDWKGLVAERYDVVVVGGGIQGAMVHFEATRIGLRSLLLERADFAGETSSNSLRIVHGGLRYLQSLDLARSIESSGEQHWFLEHMRPLVEPLPCLLPLYGRGLKRPMPLRLGLALNGLIARGVARHSSHGRLPPGDLLDPEATRAHFPAVPLEGLQGAARWFDLKMLCPARIVIETLRWAAARGGYAVNYVEAVDLRVAGGELRGIEVTDQRDGSSYEIDCGAVINAAGPAARALGARWDRDLPELFEPAVAWNLLFDRPALSDHAVALQDPAGERPLLFATALEGRLLIGTGHAALPNGLRADWRASVLDELPRFIDAINRSVASLGLTRRHVLRIYAGLMPARQRAAAEPSSRALSWDHGRARGPRGLFSVSGVKFTTARASAHRVLKQVLESGRLCAARVGAHDYPRLGATAAAALLARDRPPSLDDAWQRAELERIIDEEAVEHLDDLVLRRTNLGDDAARARALAPAICGLHPRWERNREQELARLARGLAWPDSSDMAATLEDDPAGIGPRHRARSTGT